MFDSPLRRHDDPLRILPGRTPFPESTAKSPPRGHEGRWSSALASQFGCYVGCLGRFVGLARCARKPITAGLLTGSPFRAEAEMVTGQTGLETASGSRHGALRRPLSLTPGSAAAPNSLATFAKKHRFRRGGLSAAAVNWIVAQVRWERVISARVTANTNRRVDRPS
jgi:hypothetical protein